MAMYLKLAISVLVAVAVQWVWRGPPPAPAWMAEAWLGLRWQASRAASNLRMQEQLLQEADEQLRHERRVLLSRLHPGPSGGTRD